MIVVPSGDPSVLCVSMAVQPSGDPLVTPQATHRKCVIEIGIGASAEEPWSL
jgi:uncharacterized Zn-binding protein involved in type VI secretion